MDKSEVAVIFPSYANLDVVAQTLPTIIQEVKRYGDARLVVHDSTEPHHGQQAKWDYLRTLEKEHGFFLALTTNISMGHARNMCLGLVRELYAPDFICMVEDDHGFRPGLLTSLVDAMKTHYGKVCPNGMRYGMFSGCTAHTHAKMERLNERHWYPAAESDPFSLGGSNSCFRCAPASHWYAVLKGYDTDGYLISHHQTANLRWRNYHAGFTVLFVDNGELVFDLEAPGRGETSSADEFRLWDTEYAAHDKRSIYRGKSPNEIAAARRLRPVPPPESAPATPPARSRDFLRRIARKLT